MSTLYTFTIRLTFRDPFYSNLQHSPSIPTNALLLSPVLSFHTLVLVSWSTFACTPCFISFFRHPPKSPFHWLLSRLPLLRSFVHHSITRRLRRSPLSLLVGPTSCPFLSIPYQQPPQFRHSSLTRRYLPPTSPLFSSTRSFSLGLTILVALRSYGVHTNFPFIWLFYYHPICRVLSTSSLVHHPYIILPFPFCTIFLPYHLGSMQLHLPGYFSTRIYIYSFGTM